VQGDAVVTGGEIVSHGGHVRGEVRVVGGAGANTVVHIDDVRHARHDVIDHAHFSPLDRIGRGLAGLAATIALGLVLAGLGAVLVFYGRPYLETVSDTLRGSMLRSGATGLAAGFLVLPAFVVAIVGLAVSVIGIPLLIAFVPLYPLAVATAIAFGLLAAAHAIGERTAEQRRKAFDLRYRNSYAYLFSGLGMLIAPLMAAHLVGMVGFLSVIGTLLKVVTWAVIWVVATFGFGAVILSRAGTRRTFVAPPPPDLGFEGEPFFDPAASGETNA
jgi:hypothetical protein